jgi:hypothetical protein
MQYFCIYTHISCIFVFFHPPNNKFIKICH